MPPTCTSAWLSRKFRPYGLKCFQQKTNCLQVKQKKRRSQKQFLYIVFVVYSASPPEWWWAVDWMNFQQVRTECNFCLWRRATRNYYYSLVEPAMWSVFSFHSTSILHLNLQMAEEVHAEMVCLWCERQMLKSRTLNWGQQSISSSFSTVGPVHGDFDSKDTMTLNCLQHQWSITAAT